jgi:hypothetical protein
MSIDYSTNLVVGWTITDEDIPKKFIKTIPEVSHKENRYSQKTGKRISSEIIVDKKGYDVYVFDVTEHEDPCEFLCELAATIGACVEYCFGDEPIRYSIEPVFDRKDCGGSGDDTLWVNLYSMPKYISAAEKIQQKLINLGFKLPEPRVMAILEVS